MDKLILIFSLLEVLGLVLVAVRLQRLSLTSTFRYFFAFCLFESVRIIASVAIPRNTNIYGYFYFGTQPVAWILYVLMILELFRNAFADHRAIYTVSGKAMKWCVTAALFTAAATAGIDLGQSSARYPVLEFFLLADRTITLSLFVFVVLLTLALSWFPVPLSRNVLLHTVVFTFFFAAKAALLFSRNLFGLEFSQTGTAGLHLTSLLCLLTWSVLLAPKATAQVVRSGVPRSPEVEARLMAQLEAINETLAGTFRK